MDVQRTGRIFGWLFIGTFVTSIPARILFIDGVGASWTDMRVVEVSSGSLKLGAVLEFGLIVTQIGTAIVIYPLVRRQSETVSLAYVAARIMESVFAAIGISMKPAWETDEYASIRLTPFCTSAATLPITSDAVASTARATVQRCASAGKATRRTRSVTSSATAFVAADMNAVTGVGAPSYTSGVHWWNGAADAL